MPDYTPIADLIGMLEGYEMQLVGSTAINGEGSDIDIAVNISDLRQQQIPPQHLGQPMGNLIANQNRQAHEQANRLVNNLRQAGCEISGGAHYEVFNLTGDTQFTSFRRGDFNILLCFNIQSWNRFIKGRDYCIFLRNLGVDMTSKEVRVAVHGIASGMDITALTADQERLRVR